ncbi:hypothetical protein ACHAW6_002765 [Cyclotella cf. meneghiniana]
MFGYVVRNFCHISNFNIHGLMKGCGTHVASSTTCPPFFMSIAANGNEVSSPDIRAQQQYSHSDRNSTTYFEREFTTKWKHSFKLMEQCPGLEVPAQVNEAFVQSSFITATEVLMTRVGYVWQRVKDAGMLPGYALGT